MRIVQLTPGAGKMICGACLRDSALVAMLRKLGHSVMMVPLYMPLRLEGEDPSADSPIFFSGANVFLEQKSALFRSGPKWLHRLLAGRALLKGLAAFAAKTDPAVLGEMTFSMLQGEQGRQARELEELLLWLRPQKPDLICLSNALLMGLVRRLKAELKVPVVCSLQGEDSFLDGLPPSVRERAWATLAERAVEVDAFIAPSRYFAQAMGERLGLKPEQMHVVHNGIDLNGYEVTSAPSAPPVLGFLARMCREKGLDTLVDAFIDLRRRGRVQDLRLRVGGYCGSADEPFVRELRKRLEGEGLGDKVEFCPNLSRAEKLQFLRSISVFSVPARYSEAFGLYVIEAMAAGIPVVEPGQSAFPELIRATDGGVLVRPGDDGALVEGIEGLLLDPARARRIGEAGRAAVLKDFNVERMALQVAGVYGDVVGRVMGR